MEIAEIKSRLSILTVLAYLGLKADRNMRVKCPLHEDKTPSLQIYPQTNTAYCFSATCPMHGQKQDVISLTEHISKQNTHQAILTCQSLVDQNGTPPEQPAAKTRTPVSDLPTCFQLMQLQLKACEPARQYARWRALDISLTAVGYNPYESGFDQLRNCLVFPLKDSKGHIVSLYGRSISKEESAKHFYLADRRGLYPAYPAKETRTLILTEAILDAATLGQIEGLDAQILAAYGTNGLTKEHIKAIQELENLREIIFFFDGDTAGNKAVVNYAEELKKTLPKLIISQVQTPVGEDINSLMQTYEADTLLTLLRERKTIFLSPEDAEPPQQNGHKKLNTDNPEMIHYHTDELLISLIGGVDMMNIDRMKATVFMRRNPHLHSGYSLRRPVDFYQDEQVEKLVRKAAERLEMSSSHISITLAELIEALEQYRFQKIEQERTLQKPQAKKMTASEIKAAKKNLERKDLMEWTLAQYKETGIIGEDDNTLLIHIGMTSSRYADPVSIICLSASGVGKSFIVERVAACMPDELVNANTQMTDNALYYMSKDSMKHKILIIEDMDGMVGLEYALRELISKKLLTKSVPIKNAKGQLITITITVEGPIAFCGSSTREYLYEDNANRCIIIYLDDSPEQDRRIMDYHKKVRAGQVDKEKENSLREMLKDMQRLIKTEEIINPFAPLINLPQEVFKPRRTLHLLLNFIDGITLYHQYQCDRKDGKLITHPSHIEWGFRLLKESLFRKSDEINASLRDFLESLSKVLKEKNQKSFYAQEIRPTLKKDPRTLRRYLYELQQYGYIKIVGGNKYKKGYEYELTDSPGSGTIKDSIARQIEDIMARIWYQYGAENKKGVGQ